MRCGLSSKFCDHLFRKIANFTKGHFYVYWDTHVLLSVYFTNRPMFQVNSSIYTYNTGQQVSKVIWQKAASPTCDPRGCEWIRPILTPTGTNLYSSLDPHDSALQTKRLLDWFSRLHSTSGSPTHRPRYVQHL